MIRFIGWIGRSLWISPGNFLWRNLCQISAANLAVHKPLQYRLCITESTLLKSNPFYSPYLWVISFKDCGKMELRLDFLAFATLLDPPHNLFFARLTAPTGTAFTIQTCVCNKKLKNSFPPKPHTRTNTVGNRKRRKCLFDLATNR